MLDDHGSAHRIIVRPHVIAHFGVMRSKADETEFDRFFGLLPVFMAVGFLLYFMFGKAPPPPPPASDLRGCFTAPGMPAVWFDGRRVTLGQEFPSIGYELTRSKNGLEIEFDRPVRLRQTPDARWIFVSLKEGWSYRTRLAHVINGKGYGVWAVTDADYLEFVANDYSLRAFWRTNEAACKARPEGSA